jgi:hypothetical protein
LKTNRIARDIAIFLTFLLIYAIFKGQPGGQQKELPGFKGGIMKKVALFAVVGLILFAGVAYGGGKYEDVKPLIEKMSGAFEKFITDMEKAENADAVVAALDAFAEVMKKLGPKVREITKKYPELKDEKTHPEELKPLLKKMDELGKKMFGVLGKLQQFANDPKVKEAYKRFGEAMASMNPEPEKPKEEK